MDSRQEHIFAFSVLLLYVTVGWPSFTDVSKNGTVINVLDTSHGMTRVEVICGKVRITVCIPCCLPPSCHWDKGSISSEQTSPEPFLHTYSHTYICTHMTP